MTFPMSFTINRKSQKQLKTFASAFMSKTTRIIKERRDEYYILGKDKVAGVDSLVAAYTNRRGNITTLTWYSTGFTKAKSDNQWIQLDVDDPRQTVNWFAKNAKWIDSNIQYYVDQSSAQSFVNSVARFYDRFLPGLDGGPYDIYVELGDSFSYA